MKQIHGSANSELNSKAEKLRAVLFIGAPGSGKGTQGRVLGMLPGFLHCSCGDVFRSVDLGTKLGKEFIECSRNGRLMPDVLTVGLWHSHIETLLSKDLFDPKKDLLVLDGIPRNLSQAQLIDNHIQVMRVFHLHCPSRMHLIKRLKRRAIKEGRLDDADELVINRRLDQYESDEEPLLKHYRNGIIDKIDASRSADIILREILGSIIFDQLHSAVENHPENPVALV